VTEKLFYQDAYLKQATAKVEKIEGQRVWLDKTIFFAFSGGQESDAGTINGLEISSLQKQGEDIVHELSVVPNFSVGDEVELKLDWEKRWQLMRLHAAAHIVYYFFREKTNIKKLIGSNINHDKARFDFESEESATELLPELEEKSNGLIASGKEIKTYVDEEDKAKFWWEVEGLGKMPCGGTHPKNTSEVGKIKLKRKNIGAGKERIEILLEGE
jgi:Ser-tRNA(Ala) deacylase AlaX